MLVTVYENDNPMAMRVGYREGDPLIWVGDVEVEVPANTDIDGILEHVLYVLNNGPQLPDQTHSLSVGDAISIEGLGVYVVGRGGHAGCIP